MISNAIQKVVNKVDLSREEAKEVMDQIMCGEASGVNISAFLTAMRMKGETVEEITACAMTMREKCTKLTPTLDVLDVVGTGGDGSFTFNISTISALIVSAGGVPVAKHGNRSVSSKCGSADLLESLGVKIDLNAVQSEKILNEIGMCFMFAPTYHGSMKFAAPVRRELGIRTIFNILGPLANPAGANLQLLGVYDEKLVEPLAQVLKNLGVKRAMVVHGNDGLDEITLCTTTSVCELNDGNIKRFILDPSHYGFKKCKSEDLVGGNTQENAKITLDILDGQKGPKRDVVILNSAVCLFIANNNHTLHECVNIAEDIIDSGRAKKQLDKFIKLSNEV